MIMKGIFTYDRWGMLQRFVGKLVDYCSVTELANGPATTHASQESMGSVVKWQTF